MLEHASVYVCHLIIHDIFSVTYAVSGSTRPLPHSQPMRGQEGRPSGVTASPKPRASKTSECAVDVSAQSWCVWRSVTVCVLCRLCVAALSVNSFCGSREALYGVFDGDRNVEVPYLLQCTMNDILAEELHRTKSEEDYMTNTFLVMQR